MANKIKNFTENLSLGNLPTAGYSRTFHLLIRQIGEAKTKFEEDRIISREALFLKQNISAPDLSTKLLMEYVVRLIYVEMLGHNADFGYIHAVKLTQHSTLMARRLGYLACTVFFNEDSEMAMMLVNSLQKDLKSSDTLRVCMALIYLGKNVSPEMLPVVLPLVQDCLARPKEIIRKKAIVVLYKLYYVQSIYYNRPTVLSLESAQLVSCVERCLNDKDPGVMSAGVAVLCRLVQEDNNKFKGLIDTICTILQQVISHKLPTEFDYHGIPTPWIQINILKVLADLGRDDASISSRMYPVLENCLVKTQATRDHLISKAITFECVRTISSIYPNSELVYRAISAVSKFLYSNNNSIKYIGITSLTLLVQVDPQYALDYQEIVMNCLDDPDDTLKRKTLVLLYQITNPSNVIVICQKMLDYLTTVSDQFIRGDLARKITRLAERYAPNHEWFLEIVCKVFRLSDDLAGRNVEHNLIRLIAEGTESDDENIDREFRVKAAKLFHETLLELETESLRIPDSLVRIACWGLSEYCYLVPDLSVTDIAARIAKIFREQARSQLTLNCVLQSLINLALRNENIRPNLDTMLLANNPTCVLIDLDSQQRWLEYSGVITSTVTSSRICPLDASCEDIEPDSTLSFLDSYVSQERLKGAASYQPKHKRQEIIFAKSKTVPSLIYEPYKPPSRPINPIFVANTATNVISTTVSESVKSNDIATDIHDSLPTQQRTILNNHELYLGVMSFNTNNSNSNNEKKNRWTMDGYRGKNSNSLYTTINKPQPNLSHINNSTKSFHSVEIQSNFHNPQPSTSVSSEIAQPSLSPEDEKRRSEQVSIFGSVYGGRVLTDQSRKSKKNISRNTSPLPPERQHNDNTATSASNNNNNNNNNNNDKLGIDKSQLIDFASNLSNGTEMHHYTDSMVGTNLTQHHLSPVNMMTHQNNDMPATTTSATLLSSKPDNLLSDLFLEHRTDPSIMDNQSADSILSGLNLEQSSVSILSGLNLEQSIKESTDSILPDPNLESQLNSSADATNIYSLISSISETNSHTLSDLPNPSTEPLLSHLNLEYQSNDLSSQQDSINNQSILSNFSFINDDSYPLAKYDAFNSETGTTIPDLDPELANFPRDEQSILISDANFRIAYTKIFKNDTLVIVLYFTNQMRTATQNVIFSFQLPSNLHPIDQNLEQSSATTASQKTINISELSAYSTELITREFKCTAPVMNISINGELKYRDPRNTQQRLFFTLPLSVRDLLRPLPLNERQFGEKWTSYTMYKKQKLILTLMKNQKIDNFANSFCQKLNIAQVRQLNNEILFAGYFISNIHALFHICFNSQSFTAEVAILTKNNLLTDSIHSYITKQMAN